MVNVARTPGDQCINCGPGKTSPAPFKNRQAVTDFTTGGHTEETHYFLTVDWCNKGRRGIFCDDTGKGYWLDRPYTKEEMRDILGVFWMILEPECHPFTAAEMATYTTWRPLDEYSGKFGIVRTE